MSAARSRAFPGSSVYGVNAGGKVGDDALLLYCYIVVIEQAQRVHRSTCSGSSDWPTICTSLLFINIVNRGCMCVRARASYTIKFILYK